ncbi:MAG: D-serine ammonia-lyase [Rectinemataceae bacterium]
MNMNTYFRTGTPNSVLDDLRDMVPMLWNNPNRLPATQALATIDLSLHDILDAERRLQRFAPLIRKLFPETETGIIESPLLPIPHFQHAYRQLPGVSPHAGQGTLFLKCDNALPIAGSIKARGGIYEVLKHAEDLALAAGMLSPDDDYSILAEDHVRTFFGRHTLAVGSTGNLGLSIGIMGRALGFKVEIHMSHDAKEWKKELLRSKGATVIEHADDYSSAVAEGRIRCANDPLAYFIDDENSRHLFLGYAVAALRLKRQIEEFGLVPGPERPLHVYLPCGVGGAPGGIAFGLAHVFGDNAHSWFAEPTHAPCMLAGLASRRFEAARVYDFGIDNRTEADGLAVASPSRLVARLADVLIDGEYTVDDPTLFGLLALLQDTEGVKLEPSAAASLPGAFLVDAPAGAIHIAWATGGLFIPDDLYLQMYEKGSCLLRAGRG